MSVCLFAAENKPIWMHAEEREEMSKVRRTQKCTSHIKGYFASVNDPAPSITICSSTFFLLFPLIYSQGQAKRQHPIWRVWRLVQGLQSQQVRQRYSYFRWNASRLFFLTFCVCVQPYSEHHPQEPGSSVPSTGQARGC